MPAHDIRARGHVQSRFAPERNVARLAIAPILRAGAHEVKTAMQGWPTSTREPGDPIPEPCYCRAIYAAPAVA